MSKIILKSSGGEKEYFGLTPAEIKEANDLLDRLVVKTTAFQDELQKTENVGSVKFRYKVGQFLDGEVNSASIPEKERRYFWNEIKEFVPVELTSTIDRSAKRGFYEYCYRLFTYGESLANAFSWRDWCELLDRSVTLADARVLSWLQTKRKAMKQDGFRLFLVVLNQYLKKHDTSVFSDQEVYEKYDQLYLIASTWLACLSCIEKSKRKAMSKKKKAYISEALKETKFQPTEQWAGICEKIFASLNPASQIV